MNKNIAKYFLFFVIFLIMKCGGKYSDESIIIYQEDNNSNKSQNDNDKSFILVKQTILEHAIYYNETNTQLITINNSFIDFYLFRFYYMNMTQINPNNLMFKFAFDEKFSLAELVGGDPYISIKCVDNITNKLRCNDIFLNEADYVSFDYDFCLSRIGGVISFLLILVGLFCIRYGYIYFNITTAFYSGFSIILFFRELCELMELNHGLNNRENTSHGFAISVFSLSLLTGVAYGYISIKTKYLKYISFGFIVGLIFAKFLYFLILMGINKNLFIGYILTEITSCIFFIILFFLFRNKYPKISIVYISILLSYGILYGIHILIGGLPFLPYLILAKTKYEPYDIEKGLYERLKSKSAIIFYLIFFVVITVLGFFLNYTRYKLFIEKKKKHISTL